jgi:hypothetical protein
VRVIYLGPQAIAILTPYFATAGDGPLFSPRRAEADRNARRRGGRRTKLWPSHARRERIGKSGRQPGETYTKDSYNRVIARGCDLAFRHPMLSAVPPKQLTAEQRAELGAWRKARRWSPNQLRHAAATRIRQRFGIEVVKAVLGHSDLATSEIYAERDDARARDVMREIG